MIQLNILVHSDLLPRSNICRSRLLCLIFITCRAHCWSCLSLHVLYDICLNNKKLALQNAKQLLQLFFILYALLMCLFSKNVFHVQTSTTRSSRYDNSPPPTPHPPQQKKNWQSENHGGTVDSACLIKGGKIPSRGKKKHL